MGVIETNYIARSEPKRLKDDLADEGESLIDDTDGIDFQFSGNGRWAFFERKTAHDLINAFLEANESTGEPRVVAQIRRMIEEANQDTLVCLLVEGHIYKRRGYAYAEGVRRKVSFNAIDNFLLLVQRWGVHVVRSPAINHTAARMVSVAESWITAGDKSPIIMLPKAPAPQLRTLMTFPGMGIKTAEKQAKKHITLRQALEVYLCGPAEFTGLGTKGFQKVREYLNTPISIKKR